jgi:hypothetical protein
MRTEERCLKLDETRQGKVEVEGRRQGTTR